jgi:ferredoxin
MMEEGPILVARNIIIGSGPAAAGVALALCRAPGEHVTVLDIGEQLESGPLGARDRMAGQSSSQWAPQDLDAIRTRSVVTAPRELPQKRAYGSDFPFRDVGQLAGIVGAVGANRSVVSPAYGGFSNVWGAQIMPFSRSTFARWPIRWDDIEPHYRAVLREVPLAADHDDYDELFPMLAEPQALPQLAPRTLAVLERYQRRRTELRALGVMVGRARLAFSTRECVRCGLCLTGCPYSLIYSAAHTFDKLRAAQRVSYHDSALVHQVGQAGDEAFATARDLRSGEDRRFSGDRVFVACGGLGTTRLVLGSLAMPPSSVDLSESMQFVVPFVSRLPTADPRGPDEQTFTLNQFNILVDFDGEGYQTSQIHCYPYNPAIFDGLPGALRHPAAGGVTTQLLRRATVGLGYLPSWASPKVRVTHRRSGSQLLPDMELAPSTHQRPPMYRAVMRRLMVAAPKLDLWPVVPQARLSGIAKSYHFGGSFPHADDRGRVTPTSTDRWGRLPDWDRVHLVDGSVFPSVPSTTFTLTVMANAHRIASEVLDGGAPHR